MKNILLALEFDEHGKRLLGEAERLALCFESKVWIVHVAAPDPDFVGYEPGPQYIRDFRAETLRKEHRELQELCEQFHQKGLEAEALLIQGNTAGTLMMEARKLEADIIIAGHHRRSLFRQFFQGSVSNDLLSESRIPLLIVPSDEI